MSINRLSRASIALAVLASALVAGPAAHAAAPQVSCEACIVIDGDGDVLWKRNAGARLPNASTTKMVTALVAVRSVSLDEVAVTSSAAASIGGGGLDLQTGDRMAVEDLLLAMLLSSSNDAAATLAEHVAGSQTAFVARMNRWVRRHGLSNTHFVNPHGLDATGHYSSPRDLATIALHVLDDPVLADMVATSTAQVQTPRGPTTEQNRNVLLEGYEGAIGVKTGRTLGAGNVLVAAARRGRHTVIAVAMRSADAAGDAAELMDLGFVRARRLARPHDLPVLADATYVGALVFDPAGSTAVIVADPLTVSVTRDDGPVQYSLISTDVSLPLEAGERVGRVAVIAGGRPVMTADALSADQVDDGHRPWVPNALGVLIRTVAAAVELVT